MCPFEQGSGIPVLVRREPFGVRDMQDEHSLSKSKSVSRDLSSSSNAVGHETWRACTDHVRFGFAEPAAGSARSRCRGDSISRKRCAIAPSLTGNDETGGCVDMSVLTGDGFRTLHAQRAAAQAERCR